MMGWTKLDKREAFGAVDSWWEYLCASREGACVTLNVLRDEWLGEVPWEWNDDDGQPLAEYCDSAGELRIPEKIDGRPVFGLAYGGFIGELVPTEEVDEVEIRDFSRVALRGALEALRWADDEPTVQKVKEAISQLQLDH